MVQKCRENISLGMHIYGVMTMQKYAEVLFFLKMIAGRCIKLFTGGQKIDIMLQNRRALCMVQCRRKVGFLGKTRTQGEHYEKS